ncbi:MAG: hypothetical protein CM15mP98_10870 [Paracoccaceae bacterium]|nr:MAG: hypothetical protein CM15mP98_10870 [Paracoccaceae bacterium]
MPAALSYPMNMRKYNWGFSAEPEPNLYGRSLICPRGKGLGGSSSINGMIYVKGHPQDFDNWSIQGASSWSFADVLPYFKKWNAVKVSNHLGVEKRAYICQNCRTKKRIASSFQMQLYNPVILLLKIIMATSKKALGPQK